MESVAGYCQQPAGIVSPHATARQRTTNPNDARRASAVYVSNYAVGDYISDPMFGDGIDKLTVEFSESRH